MMTARGLALVLGMILVMGSGPGPMMFVGWLSPALADDEGRNDRLDDDDDDEDDDDDDDGRRPLPPPLAAADEIVSLDLTQTDLEALEAQGFRIIEQVPLAGLEVIWYRLRTPRGMSLTEARRIVRERPSGGDADFNHFYRPEMGGAVACEGLECLARQMIDWPAFDSRGASCGEGVTIGLVDTGINAAHATFSGARLDVRRLDMGQQEPAGVMHGTAVAALLVGDPATRSPGLVPAARLVAVDAFHRAGSDERADVFTLVEALDLLAAEEVGVINLSLSGPENVALKRVIERLVTEEDIVIVAAVGNGGPAAPPAYPAAYPGVIAVTAVDRGRRVYRRAARGPHVDLAAPGVEVWTAASIEGARRKTGTSFAAPFVAAASALLRAARPDMDAGAIAGELSQRAIDLGQPGPDTVFGSGLLSIEGLCPSRR